MTGTWNYDDLLNEAKTGGAWPEGWYPVQVVSADATTTNTGKDALKLNLRVVNGAYVGKNLERTLSIQPEFPGLLHQFFSIVRGFGLTDEWLRQLGNQGLAPLAAVLPGRTAEVSVIQRPFNGRPSNDIADARPASAGMMGVTPVGVPAPVAVPPPAAAPAPVAAPAAAVAPPPAAPPAAPPVQFQQPAAVSAPPASPAAPPAAPAPVQAPVPGQATQDAAAHVASADDQWAQFQQFQAMQAQQAAAAQAQAGPPAAAPAPAAPPVAPPPPPPAPPGMPV